jgi:hypothetical protein
MSSSSPLNVADMNRRSVLKGAGAGLAGTALASTAPSAARAALPAEHPANPPARAQQQVRHGVHGCAERPAHLLRLVAQRLGPVAVQPEPLVNPEPDGLVDIAGPTLVKRNNTTYVAYHGNDGRMRITEVGNAFDRENHLGAFYHPIASDNGRAAAPSFGTDGGTEYMFYEAGPRLQARICIARAG